MNWMIPFQLFGMRKTIDSMSSDSDLPKRKKKCNEINSYQSPNIQLLLLRTLLNSTMTRARFNSHAQKKEKKKEIFIFTSWTFASSLNRMILPSSTECWVLRPNIHVSTNVLNLWLFFLPNFLRNIEDSWCSWCWCAIKYMIYAFAKLRKDPWTVKPSLFSLVFIPL